jgi:hypothetical protein
VQDVAQLFECPAASSHFLKYGKPDSKPAIPEQPKPSKDRALTGAKLYLNVPNPLNTCFKGAQMKRKIGTMIKVVRLRPKIHR